MSPFQSLTFSESSLITSLSGSKFIERLAAPVYAANILLPWVFSSSGAQSADLKFAFAGGRTSSLILEAAWLVPVSEDPFAS